MRKVAARLIPVLLVLYVIAYLDRVNVTFAQDKLESDLGFSGAVYGFGAGIFFIGYFFFEVPEQPRAAQVRRAQVDGAHHGDLGPDLRLHGAREQRGAFYSVRFLLGIAEAGFFPGMILFLSYWFPGRERAKAVGFFMSAIAISYASARPSRVGSCRCSTGSPGSTTGSGCSSSRRSRRSSRPASCSVLPRTTGPQDATWLGPTTRSAGWPTRALAREEEVRLERERHSVVDALKGPARAGSSALLYFCYGRQRLRAVVLVGEIVDKVGGLERRRQGLRDGDPLRGGDRRDGGDQPSLRPHRVSASGTSAVSMAVAAAAFALSTACRRSRRSPAWRSGCSSCSARIPSSGRCRPRS